MPNIKSAIKRMKIAEKKTLRNNILKSEYKTAAKKYEKANSNKEANAAELLSAAKKAIDHACSNGVISKNAASRKKSRLEKKLAVKSTAKKAAKKAETKAETKPATEKKTTATKTAAKKTATKKEEK